MNKLVLSLGVLSLCWFTSIDGWAVEISFDKVGKISFDDSVFGKKETSNTQTQNPPSTPTVTQVSCVQKITTTDSDGHVTITERPCQNLPSSDNKGDKRINF